MATTSVDENRRLARRVPEELATGGRPELIDELYATDAVEHSPFGDLSGRDAIRDQMDQLFAAFSDFEATVEDVVGEGDTVAMRVTLSGTHDGPLMGIEPTGKSFEVQNMVFTRVEDGKIVERWVQPDMASLMKQLGIEELPQPPA